MQNLARPRYPFAKIAAQLRRPRSNRRATAQSRQISLYWDHRGGWLSRVSIERAIVEGFKLASKIGERTAIIGAIEG